MATHASKHYKSVNSVDSALTTQIDLQQDNDGNLYSSDDEQEPIPELNDTNSPVPDTQYDQIEIEEDTAVELVKIPSIQSRGSMCDNLNVIEADTATPVEVFENDTDPFETVEYGIEHKQSNEGTDTDTDSDDETDFPQFNPMSGPYPINVYKRDWKQVKNEILAGFIVAFAQIPETVAYAFLGQKHSVFILFVSQKKKGFFALLKLECPPSKAYKRQCRSAGHSAQQKYEISHSDYQWCFDHSFGRV